LPYGIFKRKAEKTAPRVGVAIGEHILDLAFATDVGLIKVPAVVSSRCFHESSLNLFMSLGRTVWKETRASITDLLSKNNQILGNSKEFHEKALVLQKEVEMLLPVKIGDYTDFYASKEHASNVGTMWRGKENALMPNWVHLPVGYHGRASSVVISGTSLRRPKGQTRPDENKPPVFGPCKVLDFELEMAFFVGPGNELGNPIRIENAEEHMFGLVVMNDWSARDVQKWEYVPLGPFCGKNWGTSISPWVVTLEALEPFRVSGPPQDPSPLPYLQDKLPGSYDIQLTASIQSEKMKSPQVLSNTNFKFMYWSMKQQLTHHSVTGCNMNTGDLLGSGTISGSTPDSLGSLVEITWGGRDSFILKETGEERKYLQDGDSIILSAFCQGDGYRIGFGECVGKILPALSD